ncbi:MAG: peptidylprolyl isomerase [Flavobacteriaceae bacterium]|nr:peptidylprolyl isomerase [Flavobacteriaceae bacterium]
MKGTKLILLFVAAVFIASCKLAKYKDLGDGLYADIETDKGAILCQLYFEDTPLTVANFVSLAEGTNPKVSDSLKGRKFFDGLKFHRVLKDFMIQAGDPSATGRGGPGYHFEDEYPKDSLGKLKYRHDAAGVLSMANGGKGTGTNGSQFFITHKPTPWLDGIHTVFGKVTHGQEVVDSIAQNDLITSITIIRNGRKANNFDATKVFTEEYEKSILAKKKRIENLKLQEQQRYEKFLKDKEVFEKAQGIGKATKTASGLHILTLKKGTGKKFSENQKTTIHYTMSLADGKLIQSTVGKDPYTFILSQKPMIPGVKEAILKMREGGKVRLFIPYYLGYGDRPYGPFPAKSDLVFELEITKIEK